MSPLASFSGKAWRTRILSLTLGGNNVTMEDVLKFLVIAAVIAIGIVRQYKKEAQQKNTTAAPTGMPPAPEVMEAGSPVPHRRAVPDSEPFIPHYEPAKATPKKAHRNARPAPAGTTPPAPPAAETADTEYAIRSAEDARKAIVWGEILRRKYD